MQELVREYLNELGRKQRKRRRIGAIVAAFVLIVAGGVIWSLIQSGIAMTGEAKCGIEEHTHGEECYTNVPVCGQEESEGHKHTEDCYQTVQTLICGQEESEEHTHTEDCYQTENVLTCGQEESEGHVHTDACYEKQLTCGKEEHIHTDACYIDPDADVEDASLWDAQYEDVQWEEAWGANLVTAAAKQIGYKESTKNYTIAEDGSHKGYSRYGQFAGDVYADWDAAFVNFCIHYAGLEELQIFPNEVTTEQWHEKYVTAEEGKNKVYMTTPEGYEPEAGDIIFLKKDNEETETQMGIVSSYDKEKNEIKVIEGNSGNEVKENKYSLDDSHISEYLMVTEMEKAYKNIPDVSGEEKAGEAADETEVKEDAQQEPENTTEEDEQQADGEDAQAEEENWAYEESYDADKVIIQVKAGEGVVPEGAELSVTPIEKQEVTDEMSRKETKEAEAVNEQYELTEKKLQEESEKKGETLEGFLAYDICFLVDGEEVEPSGDVKVTMDFKEAMKPEGVSENATVVVNHLKEDESAEDGVVVEDLTEKEDTTIATAEADASVEKVELVTNSFSTFMIAWKFREFYIGQLSVEHINRAGELLIKKTDIPENDNQDVDIDFGSEFDLMDMFAEKEIISETNEIYVPKEIRLVKDEQSYTVTKVIWNEGYTFYNGENDVYQCQGFTENDKLQIIYEVGEVEFGLLDNIMYNGNLTLSIGNKIEQVIREAEENNETIEYVWQKKIGNQVIEKIEREKKKDGGDYWNISEDYRSLNVALDGGGLDDDIQSMGYRVLLKINGEVVKETDWYSVSYPKKVLNGDFERPAFGEDYLGSNDYQHFPVGEYGDKLKWKTTASGQTIELINARGDIAGAYLWQGVHQAAHGVQFAELNSHTDGALYQDVLTIEGTELNYFFSHKARNINSQFENKINKMYLVIIPTVFAKLGVNEDGDPIDTQEEVLEVIRNRSLYEQKYEGLLIREINSDASMWHSYSGAYVPTSYLTRFFFVSAVNEGMAISRGNFLDNVGFSQELPPVNNANYGIRIQKVITGLNSEQFEALKNKLEFNVEIKDGENEIESPFKENPLKANANTGWQWIERDGSYVGIYNYNGEMPRDGQYTISISENNADVVDYTLDPDVTISGGIPNNETKSTVIVGGETAQCDFTNNYISKTGESNARKDIQVIKNWEDAGNVYNTRPPEGISVKITGMYTDASGESHEISSEELVAMEVTPATKELTPNKEWKETWNVPVYYGGDKSKPIYWEVSETVTAPYEQKDYIRSVEETGVEGIPPVEKNETHTFINSLMSNAINWSMVKYSTSGNGTEVKLEGASFELRSASLDKTLVATGESKEEGIILWTQTNGTNGLADLTGDYVIVETQAPEGFSLSTGDGKDGWDVKLVNGIPSIKKCENIIIDGPKNGDLVIYIGNTPLYSLPESGGSGIYWYMFGGILLMAGAALITYKKRCREVLKG